MSITATFDGESFDAAKDGARLQRQLDRVMAVMADGAWRTLAEIAAAVNQPEASVSARLRDLRKARFGGHRVNRQRVPLSNGLHRYQFVPARPTPPGWLF